MANLTVKGVPEPLVAELKKLAAAHRRSLNGEVIYRLERSVSRDDADTRRFVRETDRLRAEIGIQTTVDEIISARDAGRR
ncbi:MAG: FitA-like ribbon-helix-helix domain-containing protein [Gemmatimonadaceae bacterium]